MELRKLKSDDMFTMFTILSKIGFKNLKEVMTPDKMQELMSVFKDKDASNDDKMKLVGASIIMDVVGIIIKNLPSCKSDIYQLLADLSGMKVKQIAELDIVAFTEMIVAVIKKEEFKDFFKVVSGSFA